MFFLFLVNTRESNIRKGDIPQLTRVTQGIQHLLISQILPVLWRTPRNTRKLGVLLLGAKEFKAIQRGCPYNKREDLNTNTLWVPPNNNTNYLVFL